MSIDMQYDAWEQLCANAFDVPQKGLIVLLISSEESLAFYSDASANHFAAKKPNAPLLHTVGGYISTVAHWRRFRREWQKELTKKGLTHFHMTEFEYAQNAVLTNKPLSHKSPYNGWKYEEFQPFLKRLHAVINRKNRKGHFRMAGFMATVIKADFDRFVPAGMEKELGFNSYYMWNMILNMESIAIWAEENKHAGPIHYVFASGDGEEGNIGQWFKACWDVEHMREHYKLSKSYSVMPYSIAAMRPEPAIQAADVGAYELNKYWLAVADAGYDQSLVKPRRSLLNLVKSKHSGNLMRYDELMLALKDVMAQRKAYPEWPHVGPMRPKSGS